MRRRVIVMAIAAATWTLVAWLAAEALIVKSDLPRADAIAVLSGSSTYLERTRRAAELFAQGRAPIVVLTNDGQQSGWSATEQRNPFFYERAADELRRQGVPPERIRVIPEVVVSTYDEVVHLREYGAENRLRSILVVTAPYQSRRALWTLRRVFGGSGVEVGLDAPPAGEQSPPTPTWWWHAAGWEQVPSE
ncbi:MAG TPA: YdcF family protein, partial [Pyrinomonadaceae bacterium]|nr:YdcF family protein [Pyrinomonadaceae bacterium]